MVDGSTGQVSTWNQAACEIWRLLQVGISGLSLLRSSEGSSREGDDSEGLELHFECGLIGGCFRKDERADVQRRDEEDLIKCCKTRRSDPANTFPPICSSTQRKKDPAARV